MISTCDDRIRDPSPERPAQVGVVGSRLVFVAVSLAAIGAFTGSANVFTAAGALPQHCTHAIATTLWFPFT